MNKIRRQQAYTSFLIPTISKLEKNSHFKASYLNTITLTRQQVLRHTEVDSRNQQNNQVPKNGQETGEVIVDGRDINIFQ